MITCPVFQDPYSLDLLGLEDTYGERDLEAAILRELARFLLTLGSFDTTYKGQMELYNPVAIKIGMEGNSYRDATCIVISGRSHGSLEVHGLVEAEDFNLIYQ